MKFSLEQVDIIEAAKTLIADSVYNALRVNSVAGSGKTTILLRCAIVQPVDKVVMLAFNKRIAEEIQAKIAKAKRQYSLEYFVDMVDLPEIQAATFHSFFLNYLRMRLGRQVKVDKRKNHDIFAKLFPEDSAMVYPVVQLVSALKNCGYIMLTAMELTDVADLAEEKNLELPKGYTYQTMAKMAHKVFMTSVKDHTKVDFDDMLFLPVLFHRKHGWKCDRMPVCIVDEGQDMNSLQRYLVWMIADNAIIAGDKNQAIYGFRGADYNSMEMFNDHFTCKDLGMTYSWRCPQKIAPMVQPIVPQFKVPETAMEGTIVEGTYGDYLAHEYKDRENLWVCRMNYPLFKIALTYLKHGIPFDMHPKFPTQLLNLVKNFKCDLIPEFIAKLDDWFEKEQKRLAEKPNLLNQAEDKFKALKILAKDSTNVQNLLSTLNQLMFSDEGGVRLLTVHGAKGLEAKRVIILGINLMPSERAESPEQIQQEQNLIYVAKTRALEELVLLHLEK